MLESDKPNVVLRGVSKTYTLGKDGSERGIFNRRSRQQVHALRELSLVAAPGESIGVLGRNGSGKSTLLNLIAGNEPPTFGEVYVRETPTHLGVSAALQEHLTGLANVNLGLLAMGLTPKEAKELGPEVIEWAEVSEAAARPMNTYSSGMKARLKFAIATAVTREILLVDEALSTGDAAFSEKASKRMSTFLDKAGTVFIVSHSAGTIEKFCTRALWLHNGELIGDGSVDAMTKMYRTWSRYVAAGNQEKADWVINQRRSAHKDVEVVFDQEAARMLDFGLSPDRLGDGTCLKKRETEQ